MPDYVRVPTGRPAVLFFAAVAGTMAWFFVRMEGSALLTACLYLLAGIVYMLLRWRFSPWVIGALRPTIDRRKVRVLASTHMLVLGCLIGALVVLVVANEVRAFVPSFTEQSVAASYKANKYKQPRIMIQLPLDMTPKNQLIVIGTVDEQAVLVDVDLVMADVARQALDEVVRITLSLFLIPCIGILCLRLLEPIAEI